MTDEREELEKLLNAAEEYWREHDNENWTSVYADRLLPYIQQRVDAAVKEERFACIKATCPMCAAGKYDTLGGPDDINPEVEWWPGGYISNHGNLGPCYTHVSECGDVRSCQASGIRAAAIRSGEKP